MLISVPRSPSFIFLSIVCPRRLAHGVRRGCLGRGSRTPAAPARRALALAGKGARNELPFLKEPVESRASRRIFLRSFYDKAAARFSSGFVLGRGISCGLGCSRSYFTRLLHRSFLVRRHPYPFLREYVRLAAAVQARKGLTPIIFFDRLADAGRLIKETLGTLKPSRLTISDWP